jgi:diamine N-acetyltransferase
MTVHLRELDSSNWHECRDLRVDEHQSQFVTSTAAYVMMCTYGGDWHPLTIYADDTMVGFAMWAIDPDDGSFCIGGFLIDAAHQRRGYGRAAMIALIDHAEKLGHQNLALSYHPTNVAARSLYQSMGFVETGEVVDDEVVARRS